VPLETERSTGLLRSTGRPLRLSNTAGRYVRLSSATQRYVEVVIFAWAPTFGLLKKSLGGKVAYELKLTQDVQVRKKTKEIYSIFVKRTWFYGSNKSHGPRGSHGPHGSQEVDFL
jgi:hypothetical protein